jgi:hypothetical protein
LRKRAHRVPESRAPAVLAARAVVHPVPSPRLSSTRSGRITARSDLAGADGCARPARTDPTRVSLDLIDVAAARRSTALMGFRWLPFAALLPRRVIAHLRSIGPTCLFLRRLAPVTGRFHQWIIRWSVGRANGEESCPAYRDDRAWRRPGSWASNPVRDPVARRSPAARTTAALGFASCRVVDTDTGAQRAHARSIGSRPPLPAPIRSWVCLRCRRGERLQSVQPFDRRPMPVSGLHRSPFSVLMKPMPCRSDVGSYWSRRSDRLPV